MPEKPTENKQAIAPSPDNVCVCFHVPLRKLVKHMRLQEPKVASQLSDCYGAGTGCGWCIPFLEQLFEAWCQDPNSDLAVGLSSEEYLARRKDYLKKINARRMVEVEDELSECSDLLDHNHEN